MFSPNAFMNGRVRVKSYRPIQCVFKLNSMTTEIKYTHKNQPKIFDFSKKKEEIKPLTAKTAALTKPQIRRLYNFEGR